MALHKSHNLLLVNIPVSQDTVSYQFVMNTITKAWCRFTNWNASCWVTHGADLYFAGGTTVYKAWVGNSDAGAPIVGTVAQAYSYLGTRGQKNVALVKPNVGMNNSVTAIMSLDSDFKTFDGQTNIIYSPATVSSLWGIDNWDQAIWSSSSLQLDPKWTTVPGNLGYMHSFRMQLTSSTADFSWTSTDYIVRPAGLI